MTENINRKYSSLKKCSYGILFLIFLSHFGMAGSGSSGSMGDGPFKIVPPEYVLNSLEDIVGPHATNPQAFKIEQYYYSAISKKIKDPSVDVVIRVLNPKDQEYVEFKIVRPTETKIEGLPTIVGFLDSKNFAAGKNIEPVLLFNPDDFVTFNSIFGLE